MLGWNKEDFNYQFFKHSVVIPAGTVLGYNYTEYGSMILRIASPREYEGMFFRKYNLDRTEPLECQTMKPVAMVL